MTLCNVVRSKPKRDELIWKYLLFSVNSKLAAYMVLKGKIEDESGYETYENCINCDLVDDFESVQKLLNGLKFGVVVGNPPCDNDAYIDYILKGRQLSKRYMLMLAPLKFQSEEIDDRSEELRSLFSDSEFVTYYPVKGDEFPAEMPFDLQC